MIDVKYTLGLNTNQFCDGGAGGCKRNDQKSELPTKRVRIGPSSREDRGISDKSLVSYW